MTSLFNDPNLETEESEINATIEALKTKYAKDDGSLDLDGLLKKAAHADKHIKTLEREAAARAADDKVSRTLDEILAKIEAKANASGIQSPESSTPDNSSRTETLDINKALEQKLAEWDAKKTQDRNAQYVTSKLQEMWGPDYVSKLRAKARELGESEDFLNHMALTRPETFLRLVRDNRVEESTGGFTPPQGQRVSVSSSTGKAKTYADFEKIRKTDPKLYNSKAIQDEMLRLTAEYAAQGKSFTQT
jgi:hypothetical protein